MASELRWILLALSALLLIGIWWWGVRRSRQSPGNSQLREPGAASIGAGPIGAGPTGTGPTSLGPTLMSETPGRHLEDAGPREWGVPPFEPLSIRTADFDQEQFDPLPMSATADPPDVTLNLEYVEQEFDRHPQADQSWHGTDVVAAAASPGATQSPGAAHLPSAAQSPSAADFSSTAPPPGTADSGDAAQPPAASPPLASTSAPAPNDSETQRIVTVRVSAVGDAHWPGTELLAALEDHGLKFGRYKVFHRMHHDGRTLFCAASLVEPGSFDLARMPDEEFRGLTLFAVLPGPADALETIDTLIATAVDLAEALHGAVQDAKGAPLSAQRAEALRADVARFQQSL